MDEHVLAATLWLNESIALCRIEPFYSAYRHVQSPALNNRRKIMTEIWQKKGQAGFHGWEQSLRQDLSSQWGHIRQSHNEEQWMDEMTPRERKRHALDFVGLCRDNRCANRERFFR